MEYVLYMCNEGIVVLCLRLQ